MSKEELLENIQYTRDILEENIQITNEYWSYYEKPIQLSAFIPFLIAVVSYIFFYMVIPNHKEVSPLALTIYLMILYSLGIYIANKILLKKKLKDAAPEMEALSDQYYANIDEMSEYSIIPPDYRIIHALNSFEKYLMNLRADDLKECIHIYEEDCKHNEQMAQLKHMQVQADKNARRMIGNLSSMKHEMKKMNNRLRY